MNIELYRHEHHFNQHKPKAGEKRTWWVILLTTVTMAGEIIAGLLFGSMALLADGLHMASHTTALTITALAYWYARKHAHDQRFSFGTGKVSSLAGFTSAILLAMFALIMVVESLDRFVNPVSIAFNEAIFVAVVGLIVNVVSVFILRVKQNSPENDGQIHHQDHNLRAAYLHVLADALTSLLAIIALLAGKLVGLNWMDPLMGIVGAVMVTRWSIGLLKETSRVLLDHQAPDTLVDKVKELLEKDRQTTITDLHIWSIGLNQYVAAIAIL
ncbi:MAG: CDF family Co(II)/Ni(II) efflux transporter DmeF, partial [Candidatus Marinimicrobia bacterium]|nr:CDF family Co(II)/Ni(II) efflux transporter DmeF [Candidatus Neomarinimicrobiota bacterium]